MAVRGHPSTNSALRRHCRALAQPMTRMQSRFDSPVAWEQSVTQNRPPDSVRPVPAASVRALTTPSRGEIEALAAAFDRYREHYDEPAAGSSSERWLEHYLSAGRLRAFVAEDGGEIVGFAATMEVPASIRLSHFWHVRDVFVLPTHRRRGIARALLACVKAAAVDAGALRLVLQTEDDNDTAIRLYEDSGFTVIRGYCSLTLELVPETDPAKIE